MPIHRYFLGWHSPCLPAAVDWLAQRRHDRRWDLSDLIVVVPGARAGRRLLELLIERASAQSVIAVPPRIVTAGGLADCLFESERPVADPLCCLLARVASIRQTPSADLGPLMARPPAPDDWTGCLALARQLDQLHQTLAADAVETDQVCLHGGPDFPDASRWQVLAQLQQRYELLLSEHQRIDPHRARFHALSEQRCQCQQEVVLLATADLNHITRRMLEQLTSPVHALIHAPAERADEFDAFGSADTNAWSASDLDLEPFDLRVVNRPRDQALEVVSSLQELTEQTRLDIDQITVGLGDEGLSNLLEQSLALAGLPARSAAAADVAHSRPGRLLRAFAALLEHHRFRDLAELLRHPDLDVYLRSGDEKTRCIDWLTRLDEYIAGHLPDRLDQPGTIRDDRLEALYRTVFQLLPCSPDELRPLPRWSQPIAALLADVYAINPLVPTNPADHQVIGALESLAGALRDQAALEGHPLAPDVSAVQAIALTIDRAGSDLLPHEATTPAVELLGWLELQLDDAPVLLITAVNEGSIPHSRSSDAFLPDHLRRTLGLNDDRRRFARDMYMLTAIGQSRPHVVLIGGRFSHRNDPLLPSRLLLSAEGYELARRVNFLFDRHPTGADRRTTLFDGNDTSRLCLPPPVPPAPPLTSISVTALRDYLACPYRFYLRHVLRLITLDDQAREMDGAMFGSIAHDTLSALARSRLADCDNPAKIAKFLSDRLDAAIEGQFGPSPVSVVLLQCQQLRLRLEAFARWQAQQVQDGWSILPDQVERMHQAHIDVNGASIAITGRIDRIDHHRVHGYRVIDYKTSDRVRRPEQSHRRGPAHARQWIDLQLPLYDLLARSSGLQGSIELGLMLVPKDLDQVDFAPATWTEAELQSAMALARQILSDIHASRFWPPGEPPDFDDGLGAICMDGSMDRISAIAATTRQLDSESVGGGLVHHE